MALILGGHHYIATYMKNMREYMTNQKTYSQQDFQ